MKCLVIHGSPRRGHTWDVLNIAEKEMKRNGQIQFEHIELAKENIINCVGCFNCIFKGEDKCPHKESMTKIVDKIEKSDALIVTSPVYSMQVTGLLKNFIDHMSYNFHRPRFFTKKALVITTTAGAGHKDAANYIRNVLYYWGFNHVQTIPIAYRNVKLTDKNKNRVITAAKSFMLDLKSNKLHRPSIKSVVMFNIWRAMAREKYEEGTADYDYWTNTGLENYPFSKEVKISMFKRLIGNFMYKVISK
ncbi:NAD(P)H-dependent oxidoreductase [Clostridium sp. Marseille-Q2269]|uniref:flavodoxin family protein n=1 Tax=Clostridium sp. Marseille-Q2269 TaxID=2942205 RepID=UPI0020739C89|nr:NAD(P)H-dependent oxidoreductase [Clostridium sp. Marseille-Q2269]